MHLVQRDTVSYENVAPYKVGPTAGLGYPLGFGTAHRYRRLTCWTVTLPSASTSTITKG